MASSEEDKITCRCRLCTSSDGGIMKIFGEEGMKRNLATKINECLPVLVEKEDLLPKLICTKCFQMVEQFHSFRKSCLLAELELKEQQGLTLEPECCLREIETSGRSVQPQQLLAEHLVKTEVDISAHQIPNSVAGVLADLIITPIQADISVSKSEVDLSTGLPCLGQPGPDDYVLMKEETFDLEVDHEDSNESSSNIVASKNVEFENPNGYETDMDILQTQIRRRTVLPQMWDVYEKTLRKNNIVTVTHRRYVISKRAFPCSICGECIYFTQCLSRQADENLQSHSIIDTVYDDNTNTFQGSSDKIFSCKVCKKGFPRRSSLIRHLRTHTNFKLFSCKLCGKAFNRKEHLSRHVASHSGGRPYHCDICQKPFTRKEHLSRHRLCHRYTFPYEDQSSESISMSSEAPADGTQGHSQNAEDAATALSSSQFACELCGHRFVRKEHLVRHQARMHCSVRSGGIIDEFKPYTCPICNKKFTRKEHLVRHHKIHTREFLFGTSQTVPGTDISLTVVSQKRQ